MAHLGKAAHPLSNFVSSVVSAFCTSSTIDRASVLRYQLSSIDPDPKKRPETPNRQQRNQTLQAMQAEQFSQIESAVRMAGQLFGTPQHRLRIQREFARPKRRPQELDQGTSKLIGWLWRSGDCHQ
jgi:hypothetical protein